MLFSIVVINYNYARFLAEAVESALRQTYEPKEVIVVDDGSTDDSRAVIESFGDRIQAVFKSNGGQGSAYNAGYRACRGDVVLFLDADDLLAATACEKAIRKMTDGVVKVQFPLTIVGPDSKPLGGRIPTLRMLDGDVKPTLLRYGTHGGPPASGNCFRKSFLDAVLPMPEADWRMGSDNFLTLQAPFYGLIATVPEELGMYRQHRKQGDGESGDYQLGIGNASGMDKVLQLVALDDRTLGETAAKHGFVFKSGLRGRNPSFNKIMLCAVILGRAPKDAPSRARLGLLGAWHCLWFPLYPVKRRVAGCAWFLLAGFAPRSAALRTLRFALDPNARSGFGRMKTGASA